MTGASKEELDLSKVGVPAPSPLSPDRRVLPRLLKIEEVSAETGVPVDTLRYWRRLGQGPRFLRFGGRLVCTADDLRAWFNERIAAESTESAGAGR